MSLAWAHRERVRRELAASAARDAAAKAEGKAIETMAKDKDRHELLLTQLEVDCRRLSDLPQGMGRDPLKRELVKSYLPLAEAYVRQGNEFRNIVLTQLMVWLFDLGEIDQALELAKVAIEQNQPMPERYKRDVRTFVADAVLEWCDRQKASGYTVEPYFSDTFAQVRGWAVHDAIKIKYLKLAAVEAQARGDEAQALEYCVEAERLDPAKAKVKTLKKELEKAVAAKQEAEANAAAAPEL